FAFGARCLALAPALLLAACTQPALTTSGGGSAPQAPATPKVLTIALQREPADFGEFVTSSTTAGGASNVVPIVNDPLTYTDDKGVNHPLLAAAMPSIEQGTWKIFPDGTMETTWKLRPNVKWHNGAPLTPADFEFGFAVKRDPDLPAGRNAAVLRAQKTMTFPDPQTMVISWTSLNYAGDFADATRFPKRLLEEAYATDKLGAFVNHPYFSTEFFGVGPYKLDRWERGSQLDFSRFDDYYLGRPPFDRVIVKIIGDPQAEVANILSGTVDVVLPTGVDLDAALEVKKQWEGTGNVVRADLSGRPIEFEIQFRPETARPQNGLRIKEVRQGLYQGLDRDAINVVGSASLGPLADSWVQPGEALRKDVESSIAKYPDDPSAAQRLLAQAGWAKGSDGVLVHQPDGERFEFDIWANQAIGWDKIATVAANQWKALGVQTTVSTIPTPFLGNRQYEAGYPGLFVTNVNVEQFWAQNFSGRLDSRYIAGPENNFNGSNRGGYNNPQVDATYSRIYATLDPQALLSAKRQLLQEVIGDAALMPLYWEVL
ncbi:MAG TPA: ABC transporter substrate-binding protein, partial [Chloroflexota bacterium]